MAPLATLYQQLVTQATRSERDRSADLPGGARIAVRVRDGQQTVTFSRMRVRLGVTELMTFVRHCAIPNEARRIPGQLSEQGQRVVDGVVWWYVAYTWSVQPTLEQATTAFPPSPRHTEEELFPE